MPMETKSSLPYNKIKKVVLTLICFILAKFSFSQSDTIFYDNDWNVVKRNAANYYRLFTKEGTNTLAREFFINNKPYSVAGCSSINPFVRNGKYRAYNEDGTLKSIGFYTNDIPSGRWIWFDEDGKDSTIGEYKKDGSIYILNKGHYLLLKGKKQFVIVEGEGHPPVVFLTGKGDAQYNFGSIYREIRKYTQIVAYDRAGIGNSESIGNERRVDTMAYELNELLTKGKIKPPYILVGHSLGGYLIRCFADRYPKKTAGLIFIDAACEVQFKKSLEVRTAPDKLKRQEQYKSYLLDTTGPMGDREESKYCYDVDSTGISTDGKIVSNLKLPENIPVTVLVSTQINDKVPYSKQDVDIRLRYFESWKKQAPQLKLITTNHSGHYIYMEEPTLVIDAIKDMLNELKTNTQK